MTLVMHQGCWLCKPNLACSLLMYSSRCVSFCFLLFSDYCAIHTKANNSL